MDQSYKKPATYAINNFQFHYLMVDRILNKLLPS